VRLVLHIGSHKTGTTAIQQFLVDNRSALAAQGVHYASAGASINANVVANAVALGDTEAARGFFERSVAAAREAGAATLLVSAENFYSMTVVAAALSDRRPEAAAEREPVLVERLRALLPEEISQTRVLCYFRRPDRFAESLYNQRVKYETFAESFDRCLELVEPVFAYHANAQAWAGVFGPESCTFKAYESVADDIRRAFLRDALEGVDTGAFSYPATRENERVSRDVLEFKRERNRTTPDAGRQREYRIALLLEDRLQLLTDEPKHYQEFFSPAERAAFLQRATSETTALRTSFGLSEFPALEEDSGWAPYPGLSAERRAQLQQAYADISASREVRGSRVKHAVRGVLRKARAAAGS
jgi:hypothetical protein